MNCMENINKQVFFPSLAIILALIVPLYMYPQESAKAIDLVFDFCTNKLDWVYRTACFASFIFVFWISYGKRGDVVFGKDEESPEYSDLAWVAMLFTAGVGTSIMILGFLEPVYYLSAPPFELEPFSSKAYEYAHMYGQFHWGLSAWAFYTPAIVAVALSIFNKKCDVMTLSSACTDGLGKYSTSSLRIFIDVTVIFGIIGSISTSLGIATPVVGSLIQNLFQIPDVYSFYIKLAVILIWMLIFCTSLFHGLKQGMQKLSCFNVYLALFFMACIFLIAPSSKLINMQINSIGLYLQNFITLNSWTEPFSTTQFTKEWTIFYWGWWLAFMPMMGLFIARISRGRTIRSVVWGQMLWGSLGCCLSFAVFGGYALHLQYSGVVDLASILQNSSQQEAIVAIFATFPLQKIMIALMIVLCFIYLATTITSCAYVIASSTTKRLVANEQPACWNRILWAIVFSIFSVGLIIIGGLKTVQTVAIITGFPMFFVSLILMRTSYLYFQKGHDKK